MTDLRSDALAGEIREALRALHEPYPTSDFDADWNAAYAGAAHAGAAHAGAAHAAVTRPGPARAAAAAQSGRRGRWTLAAAAAVALVLGLGLLGRSPPEVGQRPAPPVAATDPPARTLPMWYAPTDQLLQVPALSYARRPATLTTYDPIRLEVTP